MSEHRPDGNQQHHRRGQDRPGHGRHRLHRRPAGAPAPGGRPHRQGPGPDPGQDRRRAVAGRRGSGRKQPRRRRRRCGTRWPASTCCTTWSTPWLPGPASRPRKRPWPKPPRRPPRRAGVQRIVYLGGLHPARRGAVHPHAVPGGRGQGLPGQPRGRHGLPGRRGDRFRLGVVRDDPAPVRNAPADAGAQLGAEQDRGHRRPGRAALPGGRRIPGGAHQPHLRHRLPAGAHLRGHDEGVRRRGRPAATAWCWPCPSRRPSSPACGWP